MFYLLPIGVDDHTLRRLPWVSILIAALCAFAFVATDVLPENPSGVHPELLEPAVAFWEAHPGTRLPDTLLPYVRHGNVSGETVAGDLSEEQRELDGLTAPFLLGVRNSPLHRHAFWPREGLFQLGLLTSLFLHAGLLHLLGNLLFFYLTGPLLEDAWGRPVFLGFYLASGVLATAAQLVLGGHDAIPVLGASGAIAGCMGAFATRFADRKVIIGYFIWLFLRPLRGTFRVSAWLCAGLWFGSQLLAFLEHDTAGVAVAAHLGGFAFGAVFAFTVKATRVETRVLAPALERKAGGRVTDPEVVRALAELGEGKLPEAEKRLRALLAKRPEDLDGLAALTRLQLDPHAGNVARNRSVVERFVVRALADSPDALFAVMEEEGARFSPALLRPPTRFRVGGALELGPESLRIRAEEFHHAASEAEGPLGIKALTRAVELRRAREGETVTTKHWAADLKAMAAGGPRPPPLGAAAQEYTGRIRRALTPADAEALMSTLPPRVISCRMLELGATVAQMESAQGQRRSLPLADIRAVGVGVIQPPSGSGRLVLDLVIDWGGPASATGPTVLRMDAQGLPAASLSRGVSPTVALTELVRTLLLASGARGLPSREVLTEGAFPRFSSVEALNDAFYGPQLIA